MLGNMARSRRRGWFWALPRSSTSREPSRTKSKGRCPSIQVQYAHNLEHDVELLERLYDNYQNKDKLIKDKLEDVVELFYETDKSTILMTPLSNYYQVGLGENSLREAGKRHSLLSCWLFSLVIGKTKTNGRQAVEYVTRYVKLLKEFYRVGSYQSAILFGGLVSNIRTFMPMLWSRTVEAYGQRDIENCVDKIIDRVQEPLFTEKIENAEMLFSCTEVYRLVETAKAKFNKGYLLMNFHKRIQTIAKNIVACRRIMEDPYLQGKRPSRMNLNQRFIGSYVYEILERESSLTASDQF